MGEPLDNLDAVMAAVDIMTHPLGLHMSRQKVGGWVGPKQQKEPVSTASGVTIIHSTQNQIIVRDVTLPLPLLGLWFLFAPSIIRKSSELHSTAKQPAVCVH
jgi:hypothetical protein